MDVRRGPWRHTRTSPRHPGKSKQPYKVAGLRFNPKFISSISKGLSRDPSVSERLTRTTLPSLRERLPRCSPSCLVHSSLTFFSLSFSLCLPPYLPLSFSSIFLFSLVGASECAPVHRCIASTPLHYDSYIAIFIISAAHRCPRSRLTSVVSSYSSFSLFPRLLSRAECLFFFGKSLPVNSRPLGAASRGSRRATLRRARIAQWRTHSRRDTFGCPFHRRDENSRGLIRRRGERRFATFNLRFHSCRYW